MKKNRSNALKKFAAAPWLLVVFCGGMPASPAFAQTRFDGSDACKELVYQGQDLEAQAKGSEALAKFKSAAKQCPDASSPLSSLAQLYFVASGRTDPQYVENYRKQAESYARAALAIEPKDPVALEILRGLADPATGPEHKPAPEAMQALAEAEKLFAARKYDEAYNGYMAAQKLDPQWAGPWVYAGDCLFHQNKISEAEELYRKGTQVDPYFVQGWRFMAHAMALQGKTEEAKLALMNAISAQPDYMPAWENLSDLRARSGKPMTALKFRPRVSVTVEKSTGKSTINLDPDLMSKKGDDASPDVVAWMTYAVAKVTVDERAKKLAAEDKSKSEEEKSAFRQEYEAWEFAFAAVDKMTEKNSSKLTDPQLILLSDFRKNNQLDAALFLLMYREAYRADFEQWKKSQPDGIAKFIENFNMRP